MTPLDAPARRRVAAGPLAVVLAGAVVVLVLGLAVHAGWGPLLRLDGAVSRALYAGDDRSRGVSVLLAVLTAPGLTISRLAVLVPVAVRLAVRHHARTAVWVVAAAVLVAPLTTLLKDVVGRPRPPFAEGGALLSSLSFPSGHASGSATLVTVLLVLGWPVLGPSARRGALAGGAALAVLVALTRLWLGVHYLSDVVGGLALGVGWTVLTALVAGTLPGGPAALPARSAGGSPG